MPEIPFVSYHEAKDALDVIMQFYNMWLNDGNVQMALDISRQDIRNLQLNDFLKKLKLNNFFQ